MPKEARRLLKPPGLGFPPAIQKTLSKLTSDFSAVPVIAFFNEGIGSSCPEVAISDITFDGAGRRVYATFSDPVAAAAGNTPRACTADLVGSQTLVVALARDHLPASPFTLSLEEEVVGCHPDCGSGPTEITVTLE